MQHTCIKPKCGKVYNDDDPDPYYCSDCQQEKVRIIAKMERNFVPSETIQSDLQRFDDVAKVFSSPDGRKISFAKVRDL